MKSSKIFLSKGSITIRLLIGIFIAGLIAGGFWYWTTRPESELPEGIVSGNGRIEADQVDIATKYPGRIGDILVREGDSVTKGQILGHMDTAEIETQLARAKAQYTAAEKSTLEAEALIKEQQSKLALAKQDLDRALPLVEIGSLSERIGEQRKYQYDSAKAALDSAEAHLLSIQSTVTAAQASVDQVQAQLDEYILESSTSGRVLYRLAEEGEILGAGGKMLTLLDLSEVTMEIFLGSEYAGKIAIGSEARIIIDAASTEYAIPAVVSFVSPEAQFTPKQVETLSERQKLMFRVKLRIPHELIIQHIDKVKTGVRGMGYVRLDDSVAWPKFLEKLDPGYFQ
ncbi:MAG: HlyD family secretion protein [Lentimonas sp.]|jgi:HlyD family secretion protein